MKRIVLALLMILAVATACTTEADLNLDDLKTVFADKGIMLLNEDGTKNHFVLKGLKATTYKLENDESVSFYLFPTEKKREEGLTDFNQQKSKFDMQIPAIYGVKNVLILYWYGGQTGSPTRHDTDIKEAVKALSALATDNI
ncbi:hypothetical protein ACFOLF_22145 [Paenibacillus sepulcri]|uniref:Lipoprotein n=1 Tax=Paenibacillus sepulcri TaxID=359917 RepID=A0ABS7C8M2_9BACL|nr:hypothetical protein [Paenibacillus sepulcri]